LVTEQCEAGARASGECDTAESATVAQTVRMRALADPRLARELRQRLPHLRRVHLLALERKRKAKADAARLQSKLAKTEDSPGRMRPPYSDVNAKPDQLLKERAETGSYWPSPSPSSLLKTSFTVTSTRPSSISPM